ncbi:MAG: hypothetical protein ACXWUH_02715 [Burkholderiales bacterium]
MQMMWSDALFMRHVFSIASLDTDRLLGLAVLLDTYGSKDIALCFLHRTDTRIESRLADEYLQAIPAAGVWNLTDAA